MMYTFTHTGRYALTILWNIGTYFICKNSPTIVGKKSVFQELDSVSLFLFLSLSLGRKAKQSNLNRFNLETQMTYQ